jgi:hypothetical protein
MVCGQDTVSVALGHPPAASCIQGVGHILLCPTPCLQLAAGRWPSAVLLSPSRPR